MTKAQRSIDSQLRWGQRGGIRARWLSKHKQSKRQVPENTEAKSDVASLCCSSRSAVLGGFERCVCERV
jgi:hypothetical protein